MLTKDEYDIAIMTAEKYMFKAEEQLRKVLNDIKEMDEDTFKSVETSMMAYNTNQKYNYDNVVKSINLWINKRNKEMEYKKEFDKNPENYNKRTFYSELVEKLGVYNK